MAKSEETKKNLNNILGGNEAVFGFNLKSIKYLVSISLDKAMAPSIALNPDVGSLSG